MGNLLLEQNGTKAGVESASTLGLQNLAEATNQAIGVCGLRNEADTGSLKGAKSDVGEELGGGRRGQVDTSAVVGGILNTEHGDALLLEELITTELESTLEEVTGKGRTNTGQKGTSTLVGDNLAETTNQTAVVSDGVELDSCLDAVYKDTLAKKSAAHCRGWYIHIDRSEATVGDGAADGTSKGESGVESKTAQRSSGLSNLLDDGGGSRHG